MQGRGQKNIEPVPNTLIASPVPATAKEMHAFALAALGNLAVLTRFMQGSANFFADQPNDANALKHELKRKRKP